MVGRLPRLERTRVSGNGLGPGSECLYLVSDLELSPLRAFGWRVQLGSRASALLFAHLHEADIGVIASLGATAAQRFDGTVRWWQTWSTRARYGGAYCEAVRSALTLKLLTYALSGAVVAAPSTSLPETIGADRNWDYRYCWLRDAALTMRAFAGLAISTKRALFLIGCCMRRA